MVDVEQVVIAPPLSLPVAVDVDATLADDLDVQREDWQHDFEAGLDPDPFDPGGPWA